MSQARGLDIDSVDAVFNHRLPAQPEVYLHRIGRTGRGGETGRAISLVADREMNRLHGIEAFMQQGPMSVFATARSSAYWAVTRSAIYHAGN